MTLTKYCAPIQDMAVDRIDAKAILRVLEPKWREAPETMSRLRGRIEVILASAQVAGHIDPDKPNPARWRGWLDHMLPPPKKIGERGHHAAMPYADLPAFMARLMETTGVASQALPNARCGRAVWLQTMARHLCPAVKPLLAGLFAAYS